jgi:hypothetical protein
MNKEDFKARQISVWNKENELSAETNELLVDMLSQMSDDELSQLAGLELDVYKEIVEINKRGIVYVDTDINEEFNCEFEELSQIQQKEIIDHIMLHIWKI